ncbi:MAG: hypothetical protein DRN04_15895 [Thermoprotei archaeon]|nr:MAG: hypothetical protein DRN04_15895 [Thermoprotei archaeon]
MVRIYTRRFRIGWYTDELGRRRPITKRGIVIELPPTILAPRKRRKIYVSLGVSIEDTSIQDLEKLGFKRTEIAGREALELEEGLKMFATEVREDNKTAVFLYLDGEVNNLRVFDKVIVAFHKTVLKLYKRAKGTK